MNGSGNTDFRLPWDLRIVTEVMRSECRGDFLYNRKLSFLLYKKPPAGWHEVSLYLPDVEILILLNWKIIFIYVTMIIFIHKSN